MKTEKLVMICLMCIASFAIQAQKVIKNKYNNSIKILLIKQRFLIHY